MTDYPGKLIFLLEYKMEFLGIILSANAVRKTMESHVHQIYVLTNLGTVESYYMVCYWNTLKPKYKINDILLVEFR
mgnify:CR=1 FL=1